MQNETEIEVIELPPDATDEQRSHYASDVAAGTLRLLGTTDDGTLQFAKLTYRTLGDKSAI